MITKYPTTNKQYTRKAAWLGKDCFYCGEPADTADHIIATANGGAECASNFVPACRMCNCVKRDFFISDEQEKEARIFAFINFPQVKEDAVKLSFLAKTKELTAQDKFMMNIQ